MKWGKNWSKVQNYPGFRIIPCIKWERCHSKYFKPFSGSAVKQNFHKIETNYTSELDIMLKRNKSNQVKYTIFTRF
jgi:hypothetical protein